VVSPGQVQPETSQGDNGETEGTTNKSGLNLEEEGMGLECDG
jgi:hypothetical protein